MLPFEQMSKIRRSPIQLIFSLPLVLVSQLTYSTLVAAQGELPQAPDTGTPQGNPTPGGTRPEATCQQTKQPLTALVANNGKDFTLSAHPTFWFYIPYSSEEVSYLEFALKDPQEFKTVYRTAVELTEPGIIKLAIPQETKYALELEKDYSWDLILYCNSSENEPDQVLKGWVRRVANPQLETINPQDYSAYINNNIWYDAINNLAEIHFSNLDNTQLNAAWTDLLETLGRQELAQEPFVNSVLLPSK